MKPQVKESEKSRVLSTKDYSMFDFPDFKVSKKHLQRIKDSIQFKDLSKDYPVLVDGKSYRIIEGRYRFLACYDLQLPVHYKIAEVTTEKDAVRIKHIHKNISLEDVIKLYADLKPYNDILVLQDELRGYFNLNFIPYAIDEARKGGRLKTPTVCKTTFNSGELKQWNYNKVRARLIRVKNFLERYQDFGWCKKDSFYFIDDAPYTFNDYLMKHTQEYVAFYNNRAKHASDITMLIGYRDIASAINTLQANGPLYDFQYNALQSIGLDASDEIKAKNVLNFLKENKMTT